MPGFRRLKGEVAEALSVPDWAEAVFRLDCSGEELAGPLFAHLLHKDELVRWRAAEAFGMLAGRMAAERPEAARMLMRKFMWRMNEESGNLGWGIPESMACAMVRDATLAREFHTILASYIYTGERLDGNYLDHAPLRRGVYWGLGRLAGERPGLVAHAAGHLVAALESEDDAANRGLAARALGLLAQGGELAGAPGAEGARAGLEALADDPGELRLYRGGAVEDATVGELAREALQRMETA